MDAPKCWSCGGAIELKHYPKEVCQACHNAGSGVESRDMLKRADCLGDISIVQKQKVARALAIIKELEELING